jgi:hypothetical protein
MDHGDVRYFRQFLGKPQAENTVEGLLHRGEPRDNEKNAKARFHVSKN